MIISFTVQNFRSFNAETTLNLVASTKLSGGHDDHAIDLPNSKQKVLKTAVIYGANGAGKSNLFKALCFLKELVTSSRGRQGVFKRQAFRLGDSPEAESFFDLTFMAKEKVYRFAVKLDDHRITEEWLSMVEDDSEISLYERITDKQGKVKVEAGKGLLNEGKTLSALLTVGGPKNQTFLATVFATLEQVDRGKILDDVLSWFEHDLTLIQPTESIVPLAHALDDDPSFLEFASRFMRDSSTGVDSLKVEKTEITEKDLHGLLPAALAARALNELESGEVSVVVVPMRDGSELAIKRSDSKHFYLQSVMASHQSISGSEVTFDLSDESDGTQRLLNLLPALHQGSKESSVYFIDEIDRSLHPMLIWKFLQFFLRSCTGTKHQIIVTTHESNLLDLDLLRRDEIWFAEKNALGATQMYSLADFKVRKDLEIRKHYLQGRFGAVPFLAPLDSLIANGADE